MATADPEPADEAIASQPAPELSSGPGRWNWRSQMAAVGLAMIVFGLFFALSPFIFGFEGDGAAGNMIVCGALVAFLGGLRLVGLRSPLVGGAALVIAGWLFASSFFIGEVSYEAWTMRIFAAMTLFLGVLGLSRAGGGQENPSADLRQE